MLWPVFQTVFCQKGEEVVYIVVLTCGTRRVGGACVCVRRGVGGKSVERERNEKLGVGETWDHNFQIWQ